MKHGKYTKEAFVSAGRRGGRLGGKATSEAKKRSARTNGQKGGRPKKVSAGDGN